MFVEMLENHFDFSNMCRVCTKSTMSLYSLYENDTDGISSIEKLRIICGLEISDSDDYPKTICSICRKKLTNYYEFRSMCLSSQEMLSNQNNKDVFIDNFVETNVFDDVDKNDEVRYFIELDDDDINDESLLLSDIQPFFKTVNNKITNKTKFKPKKKLTKTVKYDPNKKHKCKVCKKRFSSELRVKLHMQRIHKQIYLAECKVVCPKCGMKFQQTRNLKRHLVYHNTDSYFACEFCDKKTYSKKSWRKHIKIHDGKINLICKICNKTILSELSRIYHMDYHHTKEVLSNKNYYFCCTCQQGFHQHSDIQTHVLDKHTLNTSLEHDYLKAKFDEVEKNIENMFSGANIETTQTINTSMMFKCNICSRFYKNLPDLKYHVDECFSKINRPKSFMCDVCGKCFAAAWTLTNHKAGHSTVRPFICDICGQRFKWHNDLTNHKSRIHEKVRPYVCKICGKRCGTSATLKSHQRLHTGEKPFCCGECGSRFAQSSSLKEHALKHGGGAAAACPVCAKVFQTPLRLRAHLTRHSAQRRLHACDTCGRLFTEKSSVRKHQHKIHNSVNI